MIERAFLILMVIVVVYFAMWLSSVFYYAAAEVDAGTARSFSGNLRYVGAAAVMYVVAAVVATIVYLRRR